MNSALQCISATAPFARFLMSGAYKAELNRHNTMGSQGYLARAVARLLSSERAPLPWYKIARAEIMSHSPLVARALTRLARCRQGSHRSIRSGMWHSLVPIATWLISTKAIRRLRATRCARAVQLLVGLST